MGRMCRLLVLTREQSFNTLKEKALINHLKRFSTLTDMAGWRIRPWGQTRQAR